MSPQVIIWSIIIGCMENSSWNRGTTDGNSDSRNHGTTDGNSDSRIHGNTEEQNYGRKSANLSFRKSESPYIRNSEPPSFRKSVNPRTFDGTEKALMTEVQKSQAQILELSYDFSCRIIRLYKFLNKGNLAKADRDVIGVLGLQMLRSGTSINANIAEAQHPQSDADFLSKANIALKEARETENWLNLLRDNGYLSSEQSESILSDCSRINKILITITSKVRNRLNK